MEDADTEQTVETRFSPWLNSGEAAKYVRLGRETFRSRVKAGRIKHFFVGEVYRQHPRFHVDDLDDFIRRCGRGYPN